MQMRLGSLSGRFGSGYGLECSKTIACMTRAQLGNVVQVRVKGCDFSCMSFPACLLWSVFYVDLPLYRRPTKDYAGRVMYIEPTSRLGHHNSPPDKPQQTTISTMPATSASASQCASAVSTFHSKHGNPEFVITDADGSTFCTVPECLAVRQIGNNRDKMKTYLQSLANTATAGSAFQDAYQAAADSLPN